MMIRTIIAVLVMASAGLAQTTQPGRAPAAIAQDIQSASKELRSYASSPRDLIDPAKRAEIAPKMLPVLTKMEGLMTELGEAVPNLKPQLEKSRYQLLSMKGLLGDSAAQGQLEEAAKSTDAMKAGAAKGAILVADWVRTAQDAAAQGKVLDRTEEIVKASPADGNVAMLVLSFTQFGAASEENRQRAIKMAGELQGVWGERVKAELAKAATRPAVG